MVALTLEEADQRLRYWFDACPQAAVALSGGVDSSLVAWYAHNCLGDRARAYIADSPSLKRADLAQAIAFCERYHIAFQLINTDELNNPQYAENPNNRCYYCKSTLYQDLVNLVDTDTWICSGANADDVGDYRPGMQAASEQQVKHPLLTCGLHKSDIRGLAKQLQLDCWDKPASPCLSSRIPYGQAVSAEKLQQIEAAEQVLHKRGFPIVRVRHDQNTARIEVPTEQVAALREQEHEISELLLALAFNKIEIDDEGFVSGKLNRGIAS